MKNILFLTILITLISTATYTQDLIIFKDGSVKTVSIKEVSETEIKYQKAGNTGILFSVLKTSLFSVQYKNGEKEVFNQPVVKALIEQQKPVVEKPLVEDKPSPIVNVQPAQPNNLVVTSSTGKTDNSKTKTDNRTQNNAYSETSYLPRKDYSDMFQQGKNDAKIYYKGYKGAGTGTFFASLLTGPIFGLIPAIACSSTSPSSDNLTFPSVELIRNPDYVSGYTQQAKAKKSGKVWGNYGIGTAVLLLVLASQVKR